MAWHLTETSKRRGGMATDEGPYLPGAHLGAGLGGIHFQVIQFVAMHTRVLSFHRANEPVAASLLATLRLFE